MARFPFDGHFRVTQHFGMPHLRYTALGLQGHNGTDFAVPIDTPIVAPADGEVVESSYDEPGFGFYVKIRTPLGEDWLVAHLQPWELPRPGTWVAEGHRLGYADNTGMSTGVHLHLGYRPLFWERGWPYNGYTDPLAQLKET